MQRNIGITGAGEIGRNILRNNAQRPKEEQLTITQLVEGYLPRDQIIQLLQNDPVRGKFPVDVRSDGDYGIELGGNVLQVVHGQPDEMVNWKDLNVWGVLEATGARVKEELAQEHLTQGGAQKVLVTAPTKGDAGIAHTLIPGYNEGEYNPDEHDVVTNESCTTKSAIHITNALDKKFGVRGLSLTTVHAETGQEKRDLIASMGLVDDIRQLGFNPQSTGSQGALSKAFPHIDVSAEAYRVPTPDASVSDITFKLGKRTNLDAVQKCLEAAVREGIWEIVDSIRNSADLIGNPHDAVLDRSKIVLIDKNIVRVSLGYDNAYAPTRSAIDAMRHIRDALTYQQLCP